MRLQVVSDLHLERADGKGHAPGCVVPKAPYLALLGDIGDPFSVAYEKFIEQQSRAFEGVFVVLGNHEYFHNFMDPLARARSVASKFPNVHVLEKDSVAVDGMRVLGTTLWSAVERDCFAHTSDSRCIPGWTHERVVSEHRASVAWLETQLATAVPTVVLTHHAPSVGYTSSPAFRGSALQSVFATDLTHLLKRPVVAWFHGHTHWCHATTHGEVLVASNAAGLQQEPTSYDPRRVFTL